jgi:hypothetical protein
MVVIQTRRGGDAWHVHLNNLSPTFRSKRHEDLYNINGIASFAPNFELGGPIVKNRVFLEQTAQCRYSSDDVPSRRRRAPHHALDQLLHARRRNLTPTHSLVGSADFFPSITTMATLGTFTPPDATVDVREREMLGTVTERALWSDKLVSESTVQIRGYQASVQPQGTAPMQAAAGDHARQLLQHPSALADDLPVHPERVGFGQGTHRATSSRSASICSSTTTTAPATAARC